MAQGLGIRAPERLQPSLIRPTFHFSRSIKLAIRAKAANNDEKNLFIFGVYIYLYFTPRIKAELMGYLINNIFVSSPQVWATPAWLLRIIFSNEIGMFQAQSGMKRRRMP